MLCSHCQHVPQDIHDLLELAISRRTIINEFHPHISSYTALEASGVLGCGLCTLLAQCATDQLGIDQILALSPEQESLSFKIDGYYAAGQYCIEAVTFYFGYSDAPFLFRNFELSFRVELLQSPGWLPLPTYIQSTVNACAYHCISIFQAN